MAYFDSHLMNCMEKIKTTGRHYTKACHLWVEQTPNCVLDIYIEFQHFLLRSPSSSNIGWDKIFLFQKRKKKLWSQWNCSSRNTGFFTKIAIWISYRIAHPFSLVIVYECEFNDVLFKIVTNKSYKRLTSEESYRYKLSFGGPLVIV